MLKREEKMNISLYASSAKIKYNTQYYGILLYTVHA